MLERLVAPLEANPGVVAAFGNHHVIDSAGAVLAKETEELMRERGRVRLAPGLVPDAFDFAVRYGLMAAMGCVFRRSAVDPSWLTKDLAGAYDYWLAVKLGGQGGFYFLPECVMGWRQHSDSLTHLASPEEKFGGEEYIHYALLGTATSPPLAELCPRQLVFVPIPPGRRAPAAGPAKRRIDRKRPSSSLFETEMEIRRLSLLAFYVRAILRVSAASAGIRRPP